MDVKRSALMILLLIAAILFNATAFAKKPVVPRIDPPETIKRTSALSLDHILGAYTFQHALPNTFINGYIEFFPDHQWTMVAHFDNNRDRITDRYEIFRGVYEVKKIQSEPVFVLSEKGQSDDIIKDPVFQDNKIKSFSFRKFAFSRRQGDALYFDHGLNVRKTARRLKVVTEPAGAVVYMDGVRVAGNTPMVITGPPAGRPVSLRVELVGHSTRTETIQLSPGEEKTVSYSMSGGDAELWIATTPWTRVILDGKYMGDAPIKLPNLSAGNHKVELLNDGAKIHDSFEIDLPQGEIYKKKIEYTGLLDVYVGRKADIVDRKGKVLGKAPVRDLKLPVGNHTLRLIDPETKKTKLIVVRIKLDQTTTINEAWDKLRDL